MAGRGAWVGRGAFLVGQFEQPSIAFSEGIGIFVIKLAAGIRDGSVTFDQQVLHGLGPGLAVLFKGPFEFPQVMGVAQGMEAIVAEVGFPVVMTKQPVEPGQNADRVHGFAAAFGVRGEEGVLVAGGAVQPLTLAADIDPGLVGVGHGRFGEAVAHPGLKRRQALGGFPVEVEQRAGAEGDLHLVAEIILDAVVGQELVLR